MVGDRVKSEEETELKEAKRSFLLRFVTGLFRFSMKLALVAFFVVGGLLIGGFFQFANSVVKPDPQSEIQPAQAIVALTGGSRRVEKALGLLANKKGERLLISGVNENVKMQELRTLHKERASLFDCCVDLERKALNTIGNAEESKKWLATYNYKSMVLVTSGYHMPRSLLEFRRVIPDIKIQPYPVVLKEFQKKDWWRDPKMLRLMVSEYMKYVSSFSRDYVTAKTLNIIRQKVMGG